ncbi:hypothetical protein [Helicobacter sp. MIT 01-3238]|uniref:hypothetical protein n=1 Tax=Helicobacter sp. MIT 01-3238 TaxID=398627 RepID=UPI000E1FA618|nr:hypothetical protein [Helicobacter sp. MIT 01-3238]RDU52342.1 hypothetical protein CQA40_07715 [Helicobacter sp. MIT 01-3238]
MRDIVKIALIVFVSMLEVGYTVGYAVDCREGLYEKYKAHSAEFIKLKNKCKPLLENVKRLADTYKNSVEYKEYLAIGRQDTMIRLEWKNSKEYKEAERIYGECDYLPTECKDADAGEAMKDFNNDIKEARKPFYIEMDATCVLFLDGVYDIDKAFERIARAEYEFERRFEERRKKKLASLPPKKPLNRPPSCVNFDRCEKGYATAFDKYMAEYRKALEAAEKALEPLQTAFRNSQEVKEYEAECRGITFPADKDMKDFDFEYIWGWRDLEEKQIISYIQSIIANRP